PRKAESFHGTGDISTCFFSRLAGVVCFQPCQQVGIFFHDLRDRQHGFGSLLRRYRSPRSKRFVRCINSSVDIRHASTRHSGDYFAIRWVYYFGERIPSGLDEFSIDEVLYGWEFLLGNQRGYVNTCTRHGSPCLLVDMMWITTPEFLLSTTP